jgi:hypothetical protein
MRNRLRAEVEEAADEDCPNVSSDFDGVHSSLGRLQCLNSPVSLIQKPPALEE